MHPLAGCPTRGFGWGARQGGVRGPIENVLVLMPSVVMRSWRFASGTTDPSRSGADSRKPPGNLYNRHLAEEA